LHLVRGGAAQGRNWNGSVFSSSDWVYSTSVLHMKWADLRLGTVGRTSSPTVVIPLVSSLPRKEVPDRAWWYAAGALDRAWADGVQDCMFSHARLVAMMACRTRGSRVPYMVCAHCRRGSRVRCMSQGGCLFGFRGLVDGLAVEAHLRSA